MTLRSWCWHKNECSSVRVPVMHFIIIWLWRPAVFQWITSCYKSRMTTKIVCNNTLAGIRSSSLMPSVTTLFIENMSTSKAMKSCFKSHMIKRILHSCSFHMKSIKARLINFIWNDHSYKILYTENAELQQNATVSCTRQSAPIVIFLNFPLCSLSVNKIDYVWQKTTLFRAHTFAFQDMGQVVMN